MKKNKLFVIILLLCTGLVKGQLPELFNLKKSNVELMKQKTMIILLAEEDQDYVSNLQKKAKNQNKLQDYRKAINDYNSNVQQMAAKYFTFPKQILFKTMSELKNVSVAERDNYTFLVYNLSERLLLAGDKGMGFGSISYNFWDMPKEDENNVNKYIGETHFDSETQYARFDIYAKLNSKKLTDYKENLLYRFNLPSMNPSEGDVAYSFMQLQKKCEEATSETKAKNDVKENSKIIKDKTLLIKKEDLDDDATEEKIKKVYHNKIKLVSNQEFDKAVIDKDSQYCYLIILPLYASPSNLGVAAKVTITRAHVIVDASSNKVLLTKFKGISLNGIGAGQYDKVKLKHLEKYQEETE